MSWLDTQLQGAPGPTGPQGPAGPIGAPLVTGAAVGMGSTSALVQRVRLGEQSATIASAPDGTNPGFLFVNACSIGHIGLRFTGSASNSAQTVAAQVYKNGTLAATGTAVVTSGTTPVTQVDALVTPVPIVSGDFVELAIVISASLGAALANISVSAGA